MDKIVSDESLNAEPSCRRQPGVGWDCLECSWLVAIVILIIYHHTTISECEVKTELCIMGNKVVTNAKKSIMGNKLLTNTKKQQVSSKKDKMQQEHTTCCFPFCCRIWRRRGQRRHAANIQAAQGGDNPAPATPLPLPLPEHEGQQEYQLVPEGPLSSGEDEGVQDTPGTPEAPKVQLPAPTHNQAPPAPPKPQREEVLRLTVAVTAAQRPLLLGSDGAALRWMRQKHSAVRITVAPPQDPRAPGIRLRGPRGEIEAAAATLIAIMGEAEADRRRAKRAQTWRVEVVVPVAPDRRRFVVGSGGKVLQTLLQDYADVRVSVPPPKDTEAVGVTVVGPKGQVDAVCAAISRHLQQVVRVFIDV